MHESTGSYRQVLADLESRLAALEGDPSPPRAIRGLALAAAAAAAGRRDLTRAVLRVVLARGGDPEAVREVLLQTYLFAGYPRAINALAELATLAPVPEPAPLPLSPAPGEGSGWSRDGEALCRRIYGSRYPKLREVMGRISPDLGRWMVVEGYGKVLSRPRLDSRVRELTAVAALVPLDVPDQLRAHLRGALRVGASGDEVVGTLRTASLVAPGALEPSMAVFAVARDEAAADPD
jgi:4-carboxymuconolactone decarboxylase